METAHLFQDRRVPGDWRVEWTDDDGAVEVAIFSGPNRPRASAPPTPTGNTAISEEITLVH